MADLSFADKNVITPNEGDGIFVFGAEKESKQA